VNGAIEQAVMPVEPPIKQLVQLKKKLEIFKPPVVLPVVKKQKSVEPVGPPVMVPHHVLPKMIPVVVPPTFEKIKQLESEFKPAVFNKPEYRQPQKKLVVSDDSLTIFEYQNAIRADLSKDVKRVEKKLLKYADR
jgi:hypothetical protein